MDSELSETLEIKVEMHQSSVLSPFFAIVGDIVTALAKVLNGLLYADDIAMMSETIVAIANKIITCKEAFESKILKVNLGKTKVMVSGCITKDGLSKRKVEPCGVCSLRVKANSVIRVQCGKWIHRRCVGMKKVTTDFSRNIACWKCHSNIEEAVEGEEKLCN